MEAKALGSIFKVLTLILLCACPIQTWAADDTAKQDDGIGAIDLVISLSYEPEAVYPTTDEERAPYEEVIRHFADAVYEMAEGRQQLRKVYVYTNGRFTSRADIVWGRSGWPSAAPSGRAPLGVHGPWIFQPGQIAFYDTLDFDEPIDVLEENVKGGYTLGRLWANYYYGVLSESRTDGPPSSDPLLSNPIDTPPTRSMMVDFWKAIETGDTSWLNLSGRTTQLQGKVTAQYRQFLADAWETIGRPQKDDPRTLYINKRTPRNYYEELSAIANPNVDLPGRARDILEIIWPEAGQGSGQLFLVLDTSGSMSGDKIEFLKTAASGLIDAIEPGMAEVGVISFTSSPALLYPLTEINSDADKTPIKAAINSLMAGGGTAVGAALEMSLEQLLALSTSEAVGVVFLLTDGISGDNPIPAAEALAQEEISVHTFAYGEGANVDQLQEIAAITGGFFYQSIVDPQELEDAFLAAFNNVNFEISDDVMIASTSTMILPSQTETVPFLIDSTIDEISVKITVPENGDDLDATLESPSGDLFPLTSRFVNDTAYMRTEVEESVSGEWKLRFLGLNQVTEPEFRIVGRAIKQSTYDLHLSTATGQNEYGYPEPVYIIAHARKDLPMRNLAITVTAVGPTGGSFEIPMRDDGVMPDRRAGDGFFAGELKYTQSGYYELTASVRNSSFSAEQTNAGQEFPHAPGGGQVPFATSLPVYEDFMRSDTLRIGVAGYRADDYGNVPVQGLARNLSADNTDLSARLETFDDVDAFYLTNIQTSRNNYVRVHGLDKFLDLEVKLVSADGIDEFGEALQANLTELSYPGYLLVRFPDIAPSNLYVTVRSLSGRQGQYYISAGPGTDQEVSPPISFMDFEKSNNGWFFLSPVQFVPAQGQWSEGRLNVNVPNNTNTFNFWESPLFSEDPYNIPADYPIRGETGLNEVYRTRFHVYTDKDNPAVSPTIRVRSSSKSFQQTEALVATSLEDGSLSPSLDGRIYNHYFTLPANESVFRLDFDTLNFLPDNAPDAQMRLETVATEWLGSPALLDGRFEASYNFLDENTEGWTPRTAEPLIAPLFHATGSGLEILGDVNNDDQTNFGFWGSPEGEARVYLEFGRLYKFTILMTSRAIQTNVQDLAAFRFRINDGTLKSSAILNVESISAESRLPRQAQDQYYALWYYATEEVDGQGLLLAFDYLLVPESLNDANLGIVLKGIEVESYQMDVE